MNKENWWYIALLPLIMIALIIISAIKMSSTQFEQFDSVQTDPDPIVESETTP